jgi:type VI secretion system protein ImpH
VDGKGRTAPGPLSPARTPKIGGQPPAAPTPKEEPRAPAAIDSGATADELDAVLRANGESATDAPARHRRSMTSADYTAKQVFLDALEMEPWNFDFFQTVRRMNALTPDMPGVGQSARVGEDPVRFCQEPMLAFPPNTLSKFEGTHVRGDAQIPARLYVCFMGLLGPHGPLPLHLTEYAHERELHVKDRTFSRFLDLFNHRLVSLFYRAWAVNQMPASFDRSMGAAGIDQSDLKFDEREEALIEDQDRFATYIGALFGLGMESLRLRDSVPDLSKLFFAGRLAAAAPGPEGLRAILSDFFGVPVLIDEFAGHWLELPKDCHCRLGGSPGSDPAAGSLGRGGAVAGARVWDCQGKFRIRVGPMSLEKYRSLLPGTQSAKRLESWIRNFVGDEFAWEAVLILEKEQVPRTQLGKGARLGWTTWTYGGKCPEDRADLSLRSKS